MASPTPNVMPQPKVEVEILEFNLVGPVLAVRPFCHNDNYWQVYFDGNRTIRESLAAAGFPAPMPAQMVLVNSAATPDIATPGTSGSGTSDFSGKPGAPATL